LNLQYGNMLMLSKELRQLENLQNMINVVEKFEDVLYHKAVETLYNQIDLKRSLYD